MIVCDSCTEAFMKEGYDGVEPEIARMVGADIPDHSVTLTSCLTRARVHARVPECVRMLIDSNAD